MARVAERNALRLLQKSMPVDVWFSYQWPTKESSPLLIGLPVRILPSIHANTAVFGNLAEEIIVVGERQKRDFQEIKPSDELTGPRALDAAQPVVPWIGTSCSYKTLCYDMKQPPLRAVLQRLFGGD